MKPRGVWHAASVAKHVSETSPVRSSSEYLGHKREENAPLETHLCMVTSIVWCACIFLAWAALAVFALRQWRPQLISQCSRHLTVKI